MVEVVGFSSYLNRQKKTLTSSNFSFDVSAFGSVWWRQCFYMTEMSLLYILILLCSNRTWARESMCFEYHYQFHKITASIWVHYTLQSFLKLPVAQAQNRQVNEITGGIVLWGQCPLPRALLRVQWKYNHLDIGGD